MQCNDRYCKTILTNLLTYLNAVYKSICVAVLMFRNAYEYESIYDNFVLKMYLSICLAYQPSVFHDVSGSNSFKDLKKRVVEWFAFTLVVHVPF